MKSTFAWTAVLCRTLAIMFLGFGLTLLGGLPGADHRGQQAQAAPKAVYMGNLEGTYAVQGRNPNGSAYSGTVTITVQNDIAYLQWSIAGTTYRGQGRLAGTVLTIDWGAKDPVIYQVNSDGTLAGVWSGGQASERLTPLR